MALTHKKLGITKDIMASKVLPYIIPLSIDNSLNLSQVILTISWNFLVSFFVLIINIFLRNDERNKCYTFFLLHKMAVIDRIPWSIRTHNTVTYDLNLLISIPARLIKTNSCTHKPAHKFTLWILYA